MDKKSFIVSFLLFLMIFSTTAAFANNIYDVYPYRGYYLMSKAGGYKSGTFVVSNNCNDSELKAMTKIYNSTAGKTEMSRWPNGINMYRMGCDGVVDDSIDIKLDYSDFNVTHSGGTFGGENHSTLAPSSYCSIYGESYPCGSHPSTVHLNLNKWATTTSTGRERLIIHETGHSMGLAYHCTSASIMNDGASTCNGDKWTAIMSYQATDRSGINSMYPY